MAARYEIKKASHGEFYFNLIALNGEKVLTSEQYTTKDAAMDGIAACRKRAIDVAAYEKKTNNKDQAYFVLKGGNNEVIGTSESYSSPTARDGGIAVCQAIGGGAGPVDDSN